MGGFGRGEQVNVLNIHLSSADEWIGDEVEGIVEYAKTLEGPIVAAGDFNFIPHYEDSSKRRKQMSDGIGRDALLNAVDENGDKAVKTWLGWTNEVPVVKGTDFREDTGGPAGFLDGCFTRGFAPALSAVVDTREHVSPEISAKYTSYFAPSDHAPIWVNLTAATAEDVE
jgi:hypothetical protein